jgi:protoporphyrinogen oxidase
VIYLNVALEGKLKQPDHWIYIPELKWPVYRIGSFSNAMPSMAPEGCSNLYVELSDRTTPVDKLMPIIRKLLLEMDLIDADQKIRYIQERRIQNAYVIYDFHYVENRQVLHQWLNQQEIFSIGRYGDWNYSSMEDALIDGLNLVERLLS